MQNKIKSFIFETISVLNNKLKAGIVQDCKGLKIIKNIISIVNFKPRRDTLPLITLITTIFLLSFILYTIILELIGF